METRPPKIIERIAAFLIPPVCREQILGDLAERFTTASRYLADLASVLPYVISSRVRRIWDPSQALIEAFAAFVSYVGALYWLHADHANMVQWVGLAMALTIAGLALADVYARHAAAFPALRVLVACFFCVLVLTAGKPDYAAVWALGGLTSTALIAGHRTLLPPRSIYITPDGNPFSEEDVLLRRVQTFEARIRRRNLREYVAAAAVIVFFSNFLTRDVSSQLRVSYALVIAGALWNMVQLRRKGFARSVPQLTTRESLVAFYRSELTRQRELLKNVAAWALAPMLPGLLMFLVAHVAARPQAWMMMLPFAVVCALVFTLIWSANRHAAFELEREIQSLD